jgi:Tfp pilus assembly protein PilF
MWTDAVVVSARPMSPVVMAQAATLLERARVAKAAGEVSAARRHYDRFLAATYPDLPVWQEGRREARQELAQLR